MSKISDFRFQISDLAEGSDAPSPVQPARPGKSEIYNLKSEILSGYDNPILTKDLRCRMRGAKAYWLILGYLIVLLGILGIAYLGFTHLAPPGHSSGMPFRRPVGVLLFSVLNWSQAIIVPIVAVGLTAGSIGSEYKQRTMEMLVLTSLTPRNIITGKMASAMLLVLTLLATTLPIAGICFMLGGISPLGIAVAYLALAAWGFLFCSLGVSVSTWFGNHTGWAYVVGFFLVYQYVNNAASLGIMTYMMPHSGGTWQFVYSGLGVGGAGDHGLDLAPVFGIKLPVYLVGIGANVLLGLLLLVFGMTRLRFYRCNKSLEIRTLLAGMSVVGMFLLFGNLLDAGGPLVGTPSGYIIAGIFGGFWGVVGPFIPIFSTGTISRRERVIKTLTTGPWRKKVFHNNPAGGMWFLIVWTACWCLAAALVMGLRSGGRLSDLGTLGQNAAALTASVVGLASVGILLSTILRSRVTAALLLAGFMFVIGVAMPIAWAYGDSTRWGSAHAGAWSLSYLWPGLMPLSAGLTAAGQWVPGRSGPQLSLPPDQTWIACTLAWAIIAAGALWLADRRTRP